MYITQMLLQSPLHMMSCFTHLIVITPHSQFICNYEIMRLKWSKFNQHIHMMDV
jgi:hypothetical protein